MKLFLILQICQLLQIASGQVKNCYDWDGVIRLDYPCDPSANVSACCGIGSRCITNLFCISGRNAQIVGTCTDSSWVDDACPFLLNKSTAALNFDHFKYDLNTTSCPDNTKCPGPHNQTCCDAKNGKKEIDFGNNAIIPEDLKDLSSYYEAAGYTIPSRTAESTGSAAQRTPNSSTTTGSPSTAARGIDPSIGTSASRLGPSSISSDGRDQPSGGPGLNTSARAIVGATVSLVGILLLVSCLFFIRRHRMKHRAVKPVRGIEPENAEYSQLAVTARNLSELQGSPAGVEMETTSNSAAELAGDRRQGRP